MGTFNPRVETLDPPPIPTVQAWAASYDGAQGPMIDLSQAVPGYPPHPDLLSWLAEAAGSRRYTGYGAIEGEPVLRQSLADHMTGLYGAPVEAANIHITSGANQAFMCMAMAVSGEGDAIALTRPFYFNQQTTLAMLGIRQVLVDCEPDNGFLPDIASVRQAVESGIKALALVSPNNPTGAIYPAGLLDEIFEICRSARVWLFVDETYRDFLPDGHVPHGLLSKSGWQDHLALIYSFSKSHCIPGHRLGAITASQAFVAQVAKIMDNLQICAPRAPQAAVARGLAELGEWRRQNRLEIATRVEAMRKAMAANPDWQIAAIGAYFAYVRHPFAEIASEKVAEQLALRAGILCLPGVYFGEGQERYLRFAFANADARTIAELKSRLAEFRIA